MGLEHLNITNLLSDTSVDDDELADTKTSAQILGKPGKPVSTKTIYRERNRPNGLEWVEVAGEKYSRVGALRNLVLSRMRNPNPRRGARHARTT